jgi:hypothetical protein
MYASVAEGYESSTGCDCIAILIIYLPLYNHCAKDTTKAKSTEQNRLRSPRACLKKPIPLHSHVGLLISRNNGCRFQRRSLSSDRVLRDIQKPLAKLTIPKADKVKVGSCLQGEIIQTPVTAEDITALQSLIEQDAHTLDETSKQCLQKLANAAQISLAECALLHDENQFLFK